MGTLTWLLTQGVGHVPFMLIVIVNKDAGCRLVLRFYRELEFLLPGTNEYQTDFFLQHITDNHPFFVRYKNDDIVNFL